MVDVGFASALAAGDVALKQIALILKEKNKEVGGGVEGVLNGWVEKVRSCEERRDELGIRQLRS